MKLNIEEERKSKRKGHKAYNFKNEVGNKYGKLTVLKREKNNKFGTTRWLCQCECGNRTITNGLTLRSGQTKSCGCLNGGVERSGNAIYQKTLALTRWQSKKRGVVFELTLKDFKELMGGTCYYCGQKPHIKRYAYHRTRKRLGINSDEALLLNGVDKLIPQLGYVKGNVVSCCKYCNRAKSDLSIKKFKELIIKIYNNLSNIK